RGRKTGRDALLLSFAAPGQALDDSLAVGADTDADLVFYPCAVPLRAAVLARHDDSDSAAPPGGPPPDGGTIAGLLGGYATALAADPWLDSWLAVVEIIPVRAPARAVCGADGGSLPLHPGAGDGGAGGRGPAGGCSRSGAAAG